MSLLANDVQVPNELLGKFMSKIMSAIGPKLTPSEQTDLLGELSKVDASEIQLPISIVNLKIKKLPYDIIKIENNQPERKRNVFLYSYISAKNSSGEPISVPMSQTVTVTAEINNPFAVLLKAEGVRVVTTSESVTVKLSTVFLKPLSRTSIHMHMIPTKIDEFTVTGIEMFFYGARQVLNLAEKIDLRVVDRVPRYHLVTDLPVRSELALYDGEIYKFNIWITNSGDSPITSMKLEFQEPELMRIVKEPEVPLLPSDQTSIKCLLLADKDEDLVGMKLISSCDGSDYCCSQLIRQRLVICDSLSVRRIFMMKAPPSNDTDEEDESWIANQTDRIFVGYEVDNLSECTFSYAAKVSNTKMKGLIGKNESLLMVAAYGVSELRCDGSDAERSRVISLTKFMEKKQGAGLSHEERVKVAKCVSIMQRLEAKWNFDWWVSSTRRGKLVSRAATIDDDLYNGIESRQIRANISWQFKDEICDWKNMKVDNLYELIANYGNDVIVECELTFADDEQQHSVIWEGELKQESQEGKNVYTFRICFGSSDVYRMRLSHVTKDGVTGFTPLIIHAVE